MTEKDNTILLRFKPHHQRELVNALRDVPEGVQSKRDRIGRVVGDFIDIHRVQSTESETGTHYNPDGWCPDRDDVHQPRIVASATRVHGVYLIGVRHWDRLMVSQFTMLKLTPNWDVVPRDEEQGFVDQYGKYYNRVDALAIATAAGQVNTIRPKHPSFDELYSEDLY